MGTFDVTVEVGDPRGERFEAIEALADTGASHTVLPSSLLRRLGVTAHTRAPFRVADGRQIEYDVGRTWVRVVGREELTLVVFGEEAQALLGAMTLEALLLGVDPVERRLVPVPGLLMRIAA